MADTYAGDSPNKKHARLMFWSKVLANLHRANMNGFFLVLASREGGDISTLMGFGVPPEQIIAVDLEREALEICDEKLRREFPSYVGYKLVHGDVCDVARSLKNRAAAVFLDFCNYLSPDVSKMSADCVDRAAMMNAMVGVGFMRGRERVIGKGMIERARSEVAIAQAAPSNQEFASRLEYALKDVPQDDEYVPNDGRHHALWLDVGERATGWNVMPLGAILYQGTVPMTYAVGKKVPCGYASKMSTFELQQQMIVKVRPRQGDDDEMALKRSIVENAKVHGAEKSALMHNVSKKTVVAYVAHASRGSYKEAAPLRHGESAERSNDCFLGKDKSVLP
jgi:hypothetical protein